MQPGELSRAMEMDNRRGWLPLAAGPFTLHFDPATAALRHIRLGDTEVVQAIGVVVRDHNWETILPQIEGVRQESADAGFRLTFAAHCRQREIDFTWQGEISGQADGTIRFHAVGEAHSTFRRNRIGFCILYPIPGCTGKRCIAGKVNEDSEPGVLPEIISPHQPFQNLRSFRYEALPDTWIELDLEGDTFEMEDHRNWTDASYKIYSTPLKLPFPVEVPAGTRIVQSAILTLSGNALGLKSSPNSDAPLPAPVILRLADAPPAPLPHLGLGTASHGMPLDRLEKQRLGHLKLSHLRLDLAPSEPEWRAKLSQASDDARDLGVGLEIALFLTGNARAELDALASAPRHEAVPTKRWLLFQYDHTAAPDDTVQRAREVLAPLTPEAQFVGGTDANFAELNRQRPRLDLLDAVSYSINPQVHAFDMASLVENLDGQAPTVRSARNFIGGLPLIISPVTLKPRFNPYATGPEPAPGPRDLPPPVDARQNTLFAAGWTLGSLKALCESGVHSITYYETTGRRGVMETEAGSPLPREISSPDDAPRKTDANTLLSLLSQESPTTSGEVFPMYHVFADIGAFAGGEALPVESTASHKVVGMALRSGNRQALLCANLTSEPQRIELNLPALVRHLAPRQMDPENLDQWLRQPEEARRRDAETCPANIAHRPPISGEKYNAAPRPPISGEESSLDGSLVGEALVVCPPVPVVGGKAEWELPPFAYARFDWSE